MMSRNRKCFSVIVIALTVMSCENNTKVTSQPVALDTDKVKVQTSVVEVKRDSFSLQTTFSPEFGWGYQILNYGVVFINQPHIPSVQGNKGFKTKMKAIITGEYIIYKLENNMFPPTISPQELDSLDVL